MAKKILVVDDEKDMLNTIGDLLKPEGYEVTLEQNSRKSIELSKENKYDLILLDVRMPFFGEDTLKIMRKEATGNPKIVFCTVMSRPDVNVEGSNGFIQKPIDPKRFLEEVKKYL